MKINYKLSMLAVTLLTLGACSVVEVRPGSEQVKVLTDKNANCKSLGKTRVELGVTSLTDEYIQEKLEQLAKNAAVDSKGNSVLEIERVSDGVATFEILNCK